MASTGRSGVALSRTACDRCYELKARCGRASTATPCARCERLNLVCSTIRPVKPPGRRLQSQALSVLSKPPKESEIGTWLENAPGLLREERELLAFLLGRPENIDCYVVCPSFQVSVQQALLSQLLVALPILKDAYLACASALKRLEHAFPVDADSSVRHASSAMKTLRSLQVSNSQEAVLCLTLGAALALSVQSTIGVGVADICRYCLSTTRPFVEKTVSDGKRELWHGVLVLLETMDCLVYRRKPTMRLQPRNSESVDLYLGLCSPILSYYYDLCVISHSLSNTSNPDIQAYLQNKLDGVRSSVEAWIPSHASNLVDQFEAAEIVVLLAQAKVYRLGALLVSHRLRHAFGEYDAQADVWSKEIMMELDVAQSVSQRPIRYVTLPFMVAALEVREPSARNKALQDVANYVDCFSLTVQEAGRTFLRRVWRDRDSHVTYSWFDSIHKPCPILRSLDVPCRA
ncbi:hypothetical protein F5Y01DRAFT_299980 [Xylaria sp. FL0043]|nr:hypothetical protein F5Y01DRAFT_299980 [Xylaria sp. FL0043]